MPEIDIFETVDEAVDKLKQYNKNIKREEQSTEYIIDKSVQGNIFRAFHHFDQEPKKIYRGWAKENINSIISKFRTHDIINGFRCLYPVKIGE